MKKYLIATAIVLPLTLGLGGCVVSVSDDGFDYGSRSDWEDTEYRNRKKISQLNTQMSLNDVTNLMGVPDFNELYNEGDDNVQVLFYRTHRQAGDGVTTKDECTPLVLKNGALVGWGDTAYRAIL